MEVERCTICGVPIPEGRQVCWSCESEILTHRLNYKENKTMISLIRKIIRKWFRRECPHICHLCEYRDVCDKRWWLY